MDASVGEPDAPKGACAVCAVRRVVVSLLQAGGTEERFLGNWHIWRRKLKETKHAREARGASTYHNDVPRDHLPVARQMVTEPS